MNEFGTDINVGNITNSCAHENDLISRQWLMECINEGWIKFDTEKDENKFIHLVRDIAPPAQSYTAEEIQKMQELESAQVEKAYKLGRESAQTEVIHCKECRYFGDLCPWSADQNGFCHKAYKKEELFI